MLISNWDNKDQRDVARGSNTAIYVTRVSRWKREAQYLIVDWGGSMGHWGGTVVTRGRWDAAGFAAQTPQFVTGVANGFVQFGYTGQRTADARANIRVEDVAWLCRYLGRITDEQLRAALDGQRRDAGRDRVVRRLAPRPHRPAATSISGSGLQTAHAGVRSPNGVSRCQVSGRSQASAHGTAKRLLQT